MRVDHGLHNSLQHGLRLLQDLVVPETYHAITSTGEEGRPSHVVLYARRVLASIEFNNQPHVRATEIDDEWTDRLLPAEVRTRDLTTTQPSPQPALGCRLIPAKPSSPFSKHPLTLALSPEGRGN